MRALPKIPSKLIKLALKNLRAIEKQPKKYRIVMGHWISKPDASKVSNVGFGGATMIKSLGFKPQKSVDASICDVSERNKSQIYAINSFRAGYVCDGLKWLGLDRGLLGPYVVSVRPYASNPDDFKTDMMKIVKMFEAEGF